MEEQVLLVEVVELHENEYRADVENAKGKYTDPESR